MKITLLGHMHGYGGAEKSLVILGNQLAQRGHEITLLSFSSNNCVYKLDDNIQYIYIPDCGNNKLQIIKNRFSSLKKTLQNLETDLVISFWFQLSILALFISNSLSFKVIYSERGDPSDKEYSGLNGIIRSIFFPMIDGFVFQTEGAKKYFSKLIQKKSIVIHNAIQFEEKVTSTSLNKKKHIISAGRFHPQKNFSLLVNAFSKIASEFPDYKLCIYGDGELRDQLEDQIEHLGLSTQVILPGNTNDLCYKMMESEIFVLSSDYEGMPNVLMEAMALGLPCVSTDCKPGGARELIENGVNGIIVDVNDADLLSLKIKYLLENKEEANLMGKRAKKIIDNHTYDVIYDSWNSYILKLIKEKK